MWRADLLVTGEVSQWTVFNALENGYAG
jgi:hypothetical protein